MADAITPTPGNQTSEYAVTKITVILTVAATVVGVLTDALSNFSTLFPNLGWMPKALTALGMIGSVLATLGYQYTRAQVKAAAHAASGLAAAVANAAEAAANIAKS